MKVTGWTYWGNLDYIDLYKEPTLIEESYNVVINEIKKKGYHFTGFRHQNADWGAPILDDKYILCVSTRTWGKFIAEAFPDEIDNSEGYGYIEWAWSVPLGQEDKIKTPDQELK